MTPPISLSLEVSAALPDEITCGEAIFISAWVFLPDPHSIPDTACVISLLNGGTYDKRYFHFEVPGRRDYSLADYLRARGHIVILTDHLGVGESSRSPNQMGVTRHVAAAANHAALEQIYERVQAGTLSPEFPEITEFRKIGGGHSMGAMQTITQQAQNDTFDAVLILGYTADGVHLMFGGQQVSVDPGPLDMSAPDYDIRDRSRLRETFHWSDVPEDVVRVDDQLNVEVPYVLSSQSIMKNIVCDDAAAIAVPIYINLGERDVSPDPYAEPSFCRASRDVSLHILPKSGHCQNFAESRLEMFDRIDRWVRMQFGD